MKKLLILVMIFAMSIVNSKASYIIISSDDGRILQAQSANDTQSVASISKIMTAIIVIENMDIHKQVVVDDIIDQAYGSSIYLRKNQKVTIKDLLYGLMLRSGNDAAIVLAKATCGSVERFVEKMNEKAQQLKLENTIFHNPTGLDEEDGGNISSAYDMAILMKYAMNNKIFQTIVASKHYTSSYHQYWVNKNKLLFHYDACNGGKTGYTTLAKRTLVTSANHQQLNTIVVTLNEADDFNFHQQLHETCAKQYYCKTILKQGIYDVGDYQIKVDQDLNITLKKAETYTLSYQIIDDEWIIEIRSKDHHWYYAYEIEVNHE